MCVTDICQSGLLDKSMHLLLILCVLALSSALCTVMLGTIKIIYAVQIYVIYA